MGFTINEDRGGAIARLLFLVVLVVVGLNYMEGALTGSKEASPEGYAISGVRTLVTSQFTYWQTVGSGTYADSLDLLYASNLIDSVLASGTKDGYIFTVSTGAGNDSFAIYATPITYETGTRSFFSDESGFIRYTAEERPATVDDKPLGQ
jgi:hypothetical protein